MTTQTIRIQVGEREPVIIKVPAKTTLMDASDGILFMSFQERIATGRASGNAAKALEAIADALYPIPDKPKA